VAEVLAKPAGYKGHAERTSPHENPVGILGVDHVGLPTRDPEAAGRFVEEILGGREFIKAGYTDEDIRLGRPKHIFYRVGSLVLEVAEQNEEQSGYPALDTINDQPHFALGTTAAGLLKFAEHLRNNDIPFDGPRSHRGMSAVSVYFRDPDGNNLEVTTWEDVPEELTKPLGGPHGFPVWEQLAHSWKSAK
jgi:catechol 2,3-dioxygenase-like lactoylglutathione lyase family enzyme